MLGDRRYLFFEEVAGGKMQFLQGAIRLQDLVQVENNNRNTGLVTVTGTFTEIAETILSGLLPGDRIYCFAQLALTKGATGGIVLGNTRYASGYSWSSGAYQ